MALGPFDCSWNIKKKRFKTKYEYKKKLENTSTKHVSKMPLFENIKKKIKKRHHETKYYHNHQEHWKNTKKYIINTNLLITRWEF